MSEKLFTIALPVRNGGVHLRACVESILAQSRGDFDLFILDNASSDGTTEWLATLRDPRVRLHPANRPLTIEENWSRILEIPKNEFLTTIGHDDLLDRDFLAAIASLIAAHPDAGLYLTHFRLIDGQGNFLRHCYPMPAQESGAEYLAARLGGLRDSFGTGHVMRSAAYDALGGIPVYPKLLFADDALFLQIIGGSYRATDFAELFSYRTHEGSVSTSSNGEGMFAGLEAFADLLDRLQRHDPAVAQVLHRYFPTHAMVRGSVCYTEALRRSVHSGSFDPEETKKRIMALANRFSEGDGPTLPTSFEIRLLEGAAASGWQRLAYHGWRGLRAARAKIGQAGRKMVLPTR